jgi:hypothetical protein
MRFSHAQTVYIIAGGPSLVGFDWKWFANKATIGINRAHEVLPDARALWWTDYRFWDLHSEAILRHRAPLLAAAFDKFRRTYPERVTRYRLTGMKGLDLNPGCIRHGNNGGHAALNLAVQLGARRIILVGYDFYRSVIDDKIVDHWHDSHPWGQMKEVTLVKQMLPNFAGLNEITRELGIEVHNANRLSRLKEFPFTDEVPLQYKGTVHVDP